MSSRTRSLRPASRAADIDWFVPHQANRRIIDASADKLGISRDKVVVTVQKHGNTSAASIPLALETAVRDGRIKQGHLVLLEAMGGRLHLGVGADPLVTPCLALEHATQVSFAESGEFGCANARHRYLVSGSRHGHDRVIGRRSRGEAAGQHSGARLSVSE